MVEKEAHSRAPVTRPTYARWDGSEDECFCEILFRNTENAGNVLTDCRSARLPTPRDSFDCSFHRPSDFY